MLRPGSQGKRVGCRGCWPVTIVTARLRTAILVAKKPEKVYSEVETLAFAEPGKRPGAKEGLLLAE